MADDNILARYGMGPDPWAWRSNMDAPQRNALAQPAVLKEGAAPSGYDRLFDTIYGWMGGTPDKRKWANALATAADVGTLGMVTGAYDGGRELAETGRPASLAMALMPGAKVATGAARSATERAKRAMEIIDAAAKRTGGEKRLWMRGTPDDILEHVNIFANPVKAPATTPGLTISQSTLDPKTLKAYLEKIASGQELPPIDVVNKGGKSYIYDGHHRSAAARLAGIKEPAPAARETVQGIRAYHGSPHDFDRFSLDKIGTGEGAQAYGHGLYFAENEGVAKEYRRQLGRSESPHVNVANDAMIAARENKAHAIQDLEKDVATYEAMVARGDTQYQADLDVTRRAIDHIKSGGQRPGRMYEVKINADPEHFLDWDKPLSQQSEKVQTALAAVYPKKSSEEIRARKGSQLYNMAAKDAAYSQGAKALREAGVPGIKYLDQGSRAASEGSRNYVVFDDALIEILRKYGLLPPAVAGAAAASSPDQAQAKQ